jgi:epoxyqueuosine reductase QueG
MNITSQTIEKTIRDYIDASPENTLQNGTDENAFDTPLVGFASGADPIFADYKTHVGPFHWTPAEAFALAYPDLDVSPDDLTVIAYILPQIRATKADNRKESRYPSERWARARIFGEEVNEKLRRHIVSTLQDAGVAAAAPSIMTQWETKTSEQYGYASTWSERHAAHACGLGTFGLCDGLITPLGKAMRVGSVIAHIRIAPTDRPYDNHRAYCLYFSKGICKKCVSRCPVGAISEAGKDKIKCFGHLKPATADHVKTHYGFDGYGCGLCQTGVPCESKIPLPPDAQ